jgi:hypothetical protein
MPDPRERADFARLLSAGYLTTSHALSRVVSIQWKGHIMQIATTETVTTFTTVSGEVYTIEGKKFVSRKPRGFATYAKMVDVIGVLACLDRNRSVCEKCAATYAKMVDVIGECYWVRDYAEWVELVSELA